MAKAERPHSTDRPQSARSDFARSHVAYRSYLLYCFATSLFFALTFTASSVYFIETVHLSAFQLLMVGFTLEISCFLCEMPTGIVADKYSRKLSMAIGLVLIGCGFLLEGLAPVFAAVLLAQVLWGVGVTFTSGSDSAWIADELQTDALERLYLRGAQFGQVGSLIGIIASVAFANYALWLPLVVAGALFVVFAGFLWNVFPEHNFQRSTATEAGVFRGMWSTFQAGINHVKKSTLLKLMLVVSLLTGLYSEGLDRLWTLHILSDFKLPQIGHFHDIVWFGLINACALVLNIVVVEWLQRQFEKTGRFDKVWVLVVINTLLVGSILTFALAGHLWLALAAFFMCKIIRGTNDPLYTALLNQQIQESSLRATILSTQGQWYALGEIFGGPLVGVVVWKGTVAAGLITSSVILSPVVLLYLWILRKMHSPRTGVFTYERRID